ncbi:MAG: LamG domain-containing protein, partial [Candidatus Paceibacterota bacterium]
KGNNGTWSGTSTPHYATSNGKTVGYFNGVNDYVPIPHSTSTSFSNGDFSGSAWMYITSLPQFYSGMAFGRSTAFIFYVTQNQKITAQVYNGSSWQLTQEVNVEPLSEWIFFAWKYSNQQRIVSLYVNGVEVSYALRPALNQSYPDSLSPICFGMYGSNFFNGFLKNMRLYNRVLSASEISALYNATK